MTRRKRILAGLLLAAAAAAVYAPVAGHSFLVYDDDIYVTANEMVRTGLTAEGLSWAFTTFHAGNWHPLTWLSHMLDVQLFGLRPGGHHLVSAALHAFTAALLFLVLAGCTARAGLSFVAAGLFALHPLRVESVAWVAERKDVLSGMFWVLGLGAYLLYARRPGRTRFALVALVQALGLAAKPMMVSFPLTLLLLDWWPLGRLRPDRGRAPWRVLAEKIPFVLLSAASAAMTVAAQLAAGAVENLDNLPFGARVANAAVAYVAYLWKTVWPAGLAPFYPHPRLGLPWWRTAAALSVLAAVSLAAAAARRRQPWLAWGWAWYLVTLVPVIGLFQVGSQAMADRYTYVPLIGPVLAAVWSASEGMKRWGMRGARAWPAAAPFLLASAALTAGQLAHWRDSFAIFTHTLEVTQDNWLAHNNLGMVLTVTGRGDEAMDHFREALRLKPDYGTAHYNLGTSLYDKGRMGEALNHFQEAVRLRPTSQAFTNLGATLLALRREEEAINACREAMSLDRLNPLPVYNLGNILAGQGKDREAEFYFRQALRIKPDYPEARNNLAEILLKAGRPVEAERELAMALAVKSDFHLALYNLGLVREREGREEEAADLYRRAAAVNPSFRPALFRLALLKAGRGQAEGLPR